SMKKLVLVLAVLLVSLVAATGASAGSSPSTLTVTPSIPLLGDSLVFTGCGWNATNPNQTQNLVALDIHEPDFNYVVIYVPVSKSGCFTTAGIDYHVSQTGTYTMFAFQKYRQAFLSFTIIG